MRILDLASDKSLENICIYLTPFEAKQMLGYLEDLLGGRIQHHAHLNDENYEREITLSIYQEDTLNEFDERSKKLIIEGR